MADYCDAWKLQPSTGMTPAPPEPSPEHWEGVLEAARFARDRISRFPTDSAWRDVAVEQATCDVKNVERTLQTWLEVFRDDEEMCRRLQAGFMENKGG